MSEETSKKLEELIGKVKYYKDEKIKINSFKVVGETIIVKTDGRNYTFLPSEIEPFLNSLRDFPKDNFLPEKTNEPKEIIINGYQPSAENISLKKSLMDVLKEINEGSTDEKIKKAKSICDVANTMVNIQKAEISLINAVKR